MAVSPVMDLPVRWLVPPRGRSRSSFFFSPRSRRQSLGSLLFNRPHSGVIVEEEVPECISVTSKPMRLRLRGHLHALSDVECSTPNPEGWVKDTLFRGVSYDFGWFYLYLVWMFDEVY
eukprot:scaffold9968_cov49-Cyclotella_meneghiniana.AAC.2